jgi:hypothetical protein
MPRESRIRALRKAMNRSGSGPQHEVLSADLTCMPKIGACGVRQLPDTCRLDQKGLPLGSENLYPWRVCIRTNSELAPGGPQRLLSSGETGAGLTTGRTLE